MGMVHVDMDMVHLAMVMVHLAMDIVHVAMDMVHVNQDCNLFQKTFQLKVNVLNKTSDTSVTLVNGIYTLVLG